MRSRSFSFAESGKSPWFRFDPRGQGGPPADNNGSAALFANNYPDPKWSACCGCWLPGVHAYKQEKAVRRKTSTFVAKVREFTKGGLVKGGLAIYAFPLCNRNTLGSVFNVQIENMPNC